MATLRCRAALSHFCTPAALQVPARLPLAHPDNCVRGCAWMWALAPTSVQASWEAALCGPIFALWRKGSLTWGAQISLLRLLQLLSSLYPAHLHHGCGRTTNCWYLSQSILLLPSPNLLLFCLLDKLPHSTALLRQYCITLCLDFSLSLLWATPGCQPKSCTFLTWSQSVGKLQTNPGQIPAGTQQASWLQLIY